jgi:excisionase family DNA binding protein
MTHNETLDLSDCPTMSTRTLLIDDAAAALGVSRRTVYYRIRDGRLRTVRTRCGSQRVLVSSIEALLRETGVAGGS